MCARSIFALIFAFVLLSGLALADQMVDRIVASVDGDPITMQDLKSFAKDNGGTLPADSSDESLTVQKAVLHNLISQKLVEHEASTVNVDETAVDRFISQFEVTNHVTEQQLRDQLAQHGISWSEYRKKARSEVQRMEMMERQVRDSVVITDSQVEAYYKAHVADFGGNKERFKLAQILIAVPPGSPSTLIAAARAKAEGIRRRASSGENFGSLASQFSDDDSKSQGGELGYFAPDEVLDEIHAAIAKAKPGDIPEVVETSHGFHIVKVEEHQEPGLQPLSAVREQIRQRLSQEGMQDRFKHWVDNELFKSHSVQIFL